MNVPRPDVILAPMRFAAALLLALPALAGEPGWTLPVEVATGRGDRRPMPIEVVRGTSGAVGVFTFLKETGLTFHVSKDGRAPWKVLMLPLGLPGEPLLQGDRVTVPITSFADSEVFVATFDLAKAEEVSRAKIPEKTLGMPMFSRLAASGDDRILLIGCEKGAPEISRSADGGKTWTAPERFWQSDKRDDAIAPPLFATSRGFHVVTVEDGRAVHRLSADKGATWTDDEAAPALPEEAGEPFCVAGAAAGKSLHLLFLTRRARYVHVVSRDEGKTWGAGRTVATTRDGDLAAIYQVKAAGTLVTFAWTEMGKRDLHPKKARLLVSRDSGGSWEESDVAAGLAGDSGVAAVQIESEGRLLVALLAVESEASDAQAWAIVRETTNEPATAWPEGEAAPKWWKGTSSK